MDFHTHQAQASQRTKLLVVLFALAVLALIVLLNLLLAVLIVGVGQADHIWQALDAKEWISITVIVLSGVGGASLWRWQDLRAGGQAIATELGGQLIAADSTEFYARRVLNVVEEMALASGVPVPPVYLLEDDAINAFAAGYSQADAVIGITRGTMEKLSREQLQGVIAHEFSHILNGDMRLNIRIMAMLYGILFVHLTGRFLLDAASSAPRTRSNKDSGFAGFAMLGLALIVIGSCGLFFGKLIKAAVSRQREFLADASAVQFTRNPGGISGALKVIALEGSQVRSSRSEEASHLFFGAVGKRSAWQWWAGLWATHPSVDERIRRLEPTWRGEYLNPQTRLEAEQETALPIMGLAGVAQAPQKIKAAKAKASQPEYLPLLEELNATARDAGLAPKLIYALLLAKDPSVRAQQFAVLEIADLSWRQERLLRLYEQIQQLPAEQHLALVERAVPALKQMDSHSYYAWLKNLVALIQADQQLDLFEWCLLRLVRQYLDAHFKPRPVWSATLKQGQVQHELAVLLSTLAHYGHADPAAAEQAFAHGCDVAEFSLKFTAKADFKTLNQALTKLQATPIAWRGRIIKAMNAIAHYDQELSAQEQNLLITIAALLEVPLADMSLYLH